MEGQARRTARHPAQPPAAVRRRAGRLAPPPTAPATRRPAAAWRTAAGRL